MIVSRMGLAKSSSGRTLGYSNVSRTSTGSYSAASPKSSGSGGGGSSGVTSLSSSTTSTSSSQTGKQSADEIRRIAASEGRTPNAREQQIISQLEGGTLKPTSGRSAGTQPTGQSYIITEGRTIDATAKVTGASENLIPFVSSGTDASGKPKYGNIYRRDIPNMIASAPGLRRGYKEVAYTASTGEDRGKQKTSAYLSSFSEAYPDKEGSWRPTQFVQRTSNTKTLAISVTGGEGAAEILTAWKAEKNPTYGSLSFRAEKSMEMAPKYQEYLGKKIAIEGYNEMIRLYNDKITPPKNQPMSYSQGVWGAVTEIPDQYKGQAQEIFQTREEKPDKLLKYTAWIPEFKQDNPVVTLASKGLLLPLIPGNTTPLQVGAVKFAGGAYEGIRTEPTKTAISFGSGVAMAVVTKGVSFVYPAVTGTITALGYGMTTLYGGTVALRVYGAKGRRVEEAGRIFGTEVLPFTAGSTTVNIASYGIQKGSDYMTNRRLTNYYKGSVLDSRTAGELKNTNTDISLDVRYRPFESYEYGAEGMKASYGGKGQIYLKLNLGESQSANLEQASGIRYIVGVGKTTMASESIGISGKNAQALVPAGENRVILTKSFGTKSSFRMESEEVFNARFGKASGEYLTVGETGFQNIKIARGDNSLFIGENYISTKPFTGYERFMIRESGNLYGIQPQDTVTPMYGKATSSQSALGGSGTDSLGFRQTGVTRLEGGGVKIYEYGIQGKMMKPGVIQSVTISRAVDLPRSVFVASGEKLTPKVSKGGVVSSFSQMPTGSYVVTNNVGGMLVEQLVVPETRTSSVVDTLGLKKVKPSEKFFELGEKLQGAELTSNSYKSYSETFGPSGTYNRFKSLTETGSGYKVGGGVGVYLGGTSSGSRTAPEQGQAQTPSTRQGSLGIVLPGSRTIPRQETTPITSTSPMIASRLLPRNITGPKNYYRYSESSYRYETFEYTKIPPSPTFFGLSFASGAGLKKQNRAKFAPSYNPSLVAIFTGYKGKKPGKLSIMEGLDIRPILG